MIKLPKLACVKYGINDIKINESIKKDRILDLRKKTDILIIDDEDFEPEKFLESNSYRLTKKTDVNNVKDVSEYPVILCDIRGVGQSLSEKFEGAFLIKEIKNNYPEKIVVAYTASQYDPSYNRYLKYADEIVIKGIETEDWLEILDKCISKTVDPIFQWKKIRDRLIEIDIPIIDIASLENAFVKSYNKDNVVHLEKEARKMDTSVSKIVLNFASTVVTKLIMGK